MNFQSISSALKSKYNISLPVKDSSIFKMKNPFLQDKNPFLLDKNPFLLNKNPFLLNKKEQSQEIFNLAQFNQEYHQSQNVNSKIKPNIVPNHSISQLFCPSLMQQSQNTNNKAQSDIISSHPISQLLCPSNNKILNFCCSLECQQNAFICCSSSCNCHKNHQQCYNYFVSTKLIKYLQNIEKSQMQMIDQIENSFDKIIDRISQVRQKITDKLKKTINLKMGFTGMFWNQKNNVKQIKGVDLHHFLRKFKNQKNDIENFKIKLNEELAQINLSTNQALQDFDNFIESHNSRIQLVQFKIYTGIQINSLILTQLNQLKTLNSFMEKKQIKQLKLLYRASENNFQVKDFWKKCQNSVNTVTLIMTEKLKIIGGYTPIPWKQKTLLEQYSRYYESYQGKDPQKQTFIFSLSTHQKLKLSNSEYAIYNNCHAEQGVAFGKCGLGDLVICNKANTNNSSFIFSQNNFINQKYGKNQQSYLSLTGEKQNKFKVKQWEVFQNIRDQLTYPIIVKLLNCQQQYHEIISNQIKPVIQ